MRNEVKVTLAASFAQCIFVDPAILHNHRKVLVRVFDELDIF